MSQQGLKLRDPKDLAAQRKAGRSSEMLAAMQKRKELIARSTPFDSWYPPENENILFSLVDFTSKQMKSKKGKAPTSATQYTLTFAVNDPSSADHGREFRVGYGIWPPKKDSDPEKGNVNASRLRQFMQASYSDPDKGEEECAEESNWMDVLYRIASARPPLVFEGQIRLEKDWTDNNGNVQAGKRYLVCFKDVTEDVTAAEEDTEEDVEEAPIRRGRPAKSAPVEEAEEAEESEELEDNDVEEVAEDNGEAEEPPPPPRRAPRSVAGRR